MNLKLAFPRVCGQYNIIKKTSFPYLMSIKALWPCNTEPHCNMFLLSKESHFSHCSRVWDFQGSGCAGDEQSDSFRELCSLRLLQSERTLPWRWWRATPHLWRMGINGWNGCCSWVGASHTPPSPAAALSLSVPNLWPQDWTWGHVPQTSWTGVSSSCPAEVCRFSTHCCC